MNLTRRDIVFGAAGLGLELATPLAHAAAPAVKVDVWHEPQITRFAIELPSTVKFRTHTLRSKTPVRFLVDLSPMQLTKAFVKSMNAAKATDERILAFRAGQFDETTVRLVFELNGDPPTNIHYYQGETARTQRLLIEIGEANYDPIAAILAQEEQAEKEAVKVRKPVRSDKPKRPKQQEPKKAETLVVVIDAGHGGVDPGAVGRMRTYEKNVVLAVAKHLAQRLNATPGVQAYLTRSTDVFLPLHLRAAIAVKRHAHLFVSVHADAWTTPSARGSSVFTLSSGGASSLQARWLAQTQNRVDAIGGMNFSEIDSAARSTVVDMLAETKLRYGIQLGDAVLAELSKIGPLHKDSVEYAEFAVLKAQGIPSILVETAFISNPIDEKRLNSRNEQKRLAEAIYKGILQAVESDPSLLKMA